MNVKAWLHEIGEKVSNYNLFVPDENDYDDPREETADTLAIVKQQKYSTRLYILLLLGEISSRIASAHLSSDFSVRLRDLLRRVHRASIRGRTRGRRHASAFRPTST